MRILNTTMVSSVAIPGLILVAILAASGSVLACWGMSARKRWAFFSGFLIVAYANQIAIANANAKAETDRINAENEAFVIRTEAEARKDARLAAAEAEKAELEAKSAGLNEYVIQQEWISKWNGELMPSFGDTGFGFTDYTSIVESYALNESDQSVE